MADEKANVGPDATALQAVHQPGRPHRPAAIVADNQGRHSLIEVAEQGFALRMQQVGIDVSVGVDETGGDKIAVGIDNSPGP